MVTTSLPKNFSPYSTTTIARTEAISIPWDKKTAATTLPCRAVTPTDFRTRFMPAPRAKKFSAMLERMPGRLGWTIVRVPFDVAKIWGSRGALRVRGEINGHEFRTSLFPTGRGTHYILINKKMQKGGGVRAGEQAQFKLEPDTKERPIVLPI